jgi:hypothetical protein
MPIFNPSLTLWGGGVCGEANTIILSNYPNLQSPLETEPLELSLQGTKDNGEGGDLKMKSGVLKRG